MRKNRLCIKCGNEKLGKWTKSSYCGKCASEKARKWELSNQDKVYVSVQKRRMQRQSEKCLECSKVFTRIRAEKVCSLRCKMLNEKKINQNGCWIAPILGSRGYGNISFRGMKGALTHRVSYKEFKEDFDPKLYICHKCDNPACYNPDHLFVGTPKDNIQDGIKKGRIKHVGAKGRSCKFTNLTEIQIEEMRLLHDEGIESRRLSRIFNCTQEYARKIITGKVRR